MKVALWLLLFLSFTLIVKESVGGKSHPFASQIECAKDIAFFPIEPHRGRPLAETLRDEFTTRDIKDFYFNGVFSITSKGHVLFGLGPYILKRHRNIVRKMKWICKKHHLGKQITHIWMGEFKIVPDSQYPFFKLAEINNTAGFYKEKKSHFKKKINNHHFFLEYLEEHASSFLSEDLNVIEFNSENLHLYAPLNDLEFTIDERDREKLAENKQHFIALKAAVFSSYLEAYLDAAKDADENYETLKMGFKEYFTPSFRNAIILFLKFVGIHVASSKAIEQAIQDIQNENFIEDNEATQRTYNLFKELLDAKINKKTKALAKKKTNSLIKKKLKAIEIYYFEKKRG